MKRIIQISTLALLVILSTGCKKSYTVTVNSNNTEWGTVTGSGSYKDGETVIISAVPAQGCCFVSWKDGNTANPRQIVVNGNAEYIAMFNDTITGTIVQDAVTDYDGNSYNAVWIGGQLWMKENLRTTHYSDGTEIPVGSYNASTTEPYYYYYDDPNFTSPLEKLGYHYNWPAATRGETSSNVIPSGVQGACPSGWHLPSDAEWTVMEKRLATKDVTYFGWRGDHAGKLSGEGWNVSSKTGTPGNEEDPNHNVSGFSAFPAGYCQGIPGYGKGILIPRYAGSHAFFWCATQDDSDNAWGRGLYYDEAGVNQDLYGKEFGYSVRCIRD